MRVLENLTPKEGRNSMHGAAAEGAAKGNAADKAVPSDEGIDSDDSKYGGWPAIMASDDSDSDEEEGPLETDIVEAMRELCEAGSAHMVADAWENWRRQHRQTNMASAAQQRTHKEVLSRGLDTWLVVFQRRKKGQMRAKVNCARAMLIRERFEA